MFTVILNIYALTQFIKNTDISFVLNILRLYTNLVMKTIILIYHLFINTIYFHYTIC